MHPRHPLLVATLQLLCAGRIVLRDEVVELDGRAVGFLQWYRPEDEAEWYPGVNIPTGTAAVDMAIGDPDLIGQGLGRRVLLEFVHHVLRPTADPPEVWIDPDPRNARALLRQHGPGGRCQCDLAFAQRARPSAAGFQGATFVCVKNFSIT